MQRVIEARAAGRRTRLAVVVAAVILVLAVALAWHLHADAVPATPADTSGGLSWPALLALLLVALIAGVAGHALARLSHGEALREARVQAQLQAQLLDAWQWHTDREHRLIRLQPPQGAPGSSWVEGAGGAQPLWERFAAAEAAGSLRARLDARAPLLDMPVVRGAAAWTLRGLPRFDGAGCFAGYVGTARPLGAEPARRADAAAGDDGGDPSDHESFSYTVSHDLRAPLRVVEGFTRILIEDYGRVIDRIGNDHLERVLAAAARMNHMIDALLALAQLSNQPLAQQPVNLSQLAGFVVEDLHRQQPERRVDVQIEPGLMAHGDPTLLRVVLENLLGNAWKYSAKAPAAAIAFECSAQDGRRVYAVRDNGAGFDMRFADRLFGVFQRLHSASDFAGTGVGLASVRRIVRRHGGDIWAEGEVGSGARFFFTLGGS